MQEITLGSSAAICESDPCATITIHTTSGDDFIVTIGSQEYLLRRSEMEHMLRQKALPITILDAILKYADNVHDRHVSRNHREEIVMFP